MIMLLWVFCSLVITSLWYLFEKSKWREERRRLAELLERPLFEPLALTPVTLESSRILKELLERQSVAKIHRAESPYRTRPELAAPKRRRLANRRRVVS